MSLRFCSNRISLQNFLNTWRQRCSNLDFYSVRSIEGGRKSMFKQLQNSCIWSLDFESDDQFIRKIRILNLRSSSIVQGELKSKPFGVTWLIISTRNLSGPQLKWHAYVSSGYLFLIPHWTKNRTVAYISRLDHCGAVIHVTNYILRIRLYHFDIIFIMIIHKNNVFIPC